MSSLCIAPFLKTWISNLWFQDLLDGKPRYAITGEPRNPGWPSLSKKLILAHPFCSVCGWTKNLNAHHKLPFHLYPEKEMDPDNIIILGEACPGGNHHLWWGHLGNWQSYNADVVEMAARMYEHLTQRPIVPYHVG
jgi:DNA-binding transcriptional LysR family regulator